MPRRGPATPSTVALRIALDDTPDAIPALLARIGTAGGTLRTLSTVRRIEAPESSEAGSAPTTGPAASAAPAASAGTTATASPAGAELEIEVEGIDEERLIRAIHGLPGLRAQRFTKSLERVFGKRVIVIGGGAQVAQVALGAVSEADRHNLRGERISVDTIALVGEENIAAAVRAVADLPRARMLVLAGSIMGGDITRAARELREHGIPIIALNMVGSITEAVDLVVSDPVQAGTMAVMAVADTAAFDIARQRGRRY
jgi:energy-converting hydrogenase B subunit Q